MDAEVVIAGMRYAVDLARPRSLAILLDFDGAQPNFFAAPRARAEPLRSDAFVGDVGAGGGCNVSALSLVPHCNGTHTEGAGHIVRGGSKACDAVTETFLPALVVSVTPVPAGTCGEDCGPSAEPQDRVIPRAALSTGLADFTDDLLTALVVRTLPNDAGKMSRFYDDEDPPAYFTADAMRYAVERGVRHLVVDLPSIDRMRDDGGMTNHHIFWNVPHGTHEPTPDMRADCSVTEMAFVDDGIEDGLYLLNLQLPAFRSDAAPSRPMLHALEPISQ